MKLFKIGACLKAENNPFWSVDVRRGLEESSKDLGDIRLTYKTPERITQVKKQQKILLKFIKEKVDAIILAPSDPIQLIQSIKKINEANIPLVIIDSRIDEKEIKKHNLSFTFIGFDDYKGGYETGHFLILNLPKNSQVAIIEGYPFGSYTRRVTGFKEAIKGYFNICATVSANFEEEAAYTETKKVILKHPNIRAIFCTSDNMAMGCLMALFELNRLDIKVCGFDATHAGKLALEKSRILSTINTNPEEMGRRSIQAAHEILLGHSIADETEYFIKILTKESLKKIPKQVIQKRTYRIVYPSSDLREFKYNSLHESQDCPIILGRDFLRDVPPRLKELNADRYYIITDSIVRKIYGDKLHNALKKQELEAAIFEFEAGEKQKTFTTLNNLASKVLDAGISKNSCLILLGGGVVGNLAGFLSAILMRGIRFVHIPTTIMAQIDSTTGGKQSVNTEHGKNLLGTFYEPEFIYIDFSVIKTLVKREYRSGIAEAIKHGLCQSKKLLDLIDRNDYENIVEETIRLKTYLIDIDPREQYHGLILVYGHTIGHALETASNHTLNHGEAISIGMVAAAKISENLGYCNKGLTKFHENILQKHGLPITIPRNIDLQEVFRILLYDKKERKKVIPFVLLEDIERVKIINNNYLIPVKNLLISKILKDLQY